MYGLGFFSFNIVDSQCESGHRGHSVSPPSAVVFGCPDSRTEMLLTPQVHMG